MDDSLEEPWGLLVTKEGDENERVPILGQEFTIGRAKGNTSIIISHDQTVIYRCVSFV